MNSSPLHRSVLQIKNNVERVEKNKENVVQGVQYAHGDNESTISLRTELFSEKNRADRLEIAVKVKDDKIHQLTEENTAMRNRLIALERENKMFENYAMECAMLMEALKTDMRVNNETMN